MEDSPKGREIKHVEGRPGEIVSRGKQIESLGKKMHEAATTLRTLKDNTLSDGQQQGQAIRKLQEIIGDSHEKLREAGDLYEPVGPVLVQYGEALESCKPRIDSSANTCKELWSTYESLPGDKDDSTTEEEGGLLGIGGTDKEEAADNKAKKQAYDNWKAEAETFDTWYDVWEDAFDTATNGITDGTSGKIEDSFWSDVADVFAVVTAVVAIAALIIGGPILATIALVAGAIYLAAVIGQYANGEANKTDIFMAALGVIPFGKLTTVGKLAHFNKAAAKSALLGKFTACKGVTNAIKNPKLFYKDGLIGAFKYRGAGNGFNKLIFGNEGFKSVYRAHKSLWEGAQFAATRNGSAVRNLAAFDFAISSATGALGNYDKIDRLPGFDIPNAPKLPGWVG
ncbi:hypothetical protein G5C66_25410 [Nocardioides sp. KC13]|uniref:WXG100 family type VII secretion target n=1 Tax=Nocardioides turkmenicus TaxID=2711220 RepID=A0A6M1R1B6_9ACTN|nr:hypothetical protein [Nocardioides sp. KC13]NGN96063.1 hypothetical protein [Nocardioides sp. KC13]